MNPLIKRPSAWLPLAMSFAIACVLLTAFLTHGITYEKDEGVAAHLFQLLLFGQMPIIAFFAFTTLGREPKQALKILALQIIAAAIVCAPVFILGL